MFKNKKILKYYIKYSYNILLLFFKISYVSLFLNFIVILKFYYYSFIFSISHFSILLNFLIKQL